eukprot:TRINITY_DN1672_c1_g1_i1.p1 TRINITY_DN1672_c1_g1~~TRINITY_DN1672_c1_g1_i1.p1  ORF type:complete len:245 (-),score=22.60 TRINITY_DN1672_c1_g1_i1:42-740(-)
MSELTIGPSYDECEVDLSTEERPLKFSILCYHSLPLDEAVSLLTGADYTGQLLWAGGRELCNYLCKTPGLVRDRTVIELGSGTGLVGLVCATLGASYVSCTDGADIAIELLQRNFERNSCSRSNTNISAVKWVWDEPMPNSLTPADIVLAADVLYSQDSVGPLLRTACKALHHTDSTFLLYHMPRGWDHIANQAILQAVYQQSADLGLTLSVVQKDLCAPSGMLFRFTTKSD